VPEFCTCGAKLPEDARFCHKCGKPQREEPLLVEEPPEPPPFLPPPPLAPPPPVLPPPIGFHNGPAVRVALLCGVLAFLMSIISGQVLPAFGLVWLVAAGFLAVYLYYRRTGQKLTVMHGAHLGWISGIFGFAITAILLTLMVVALSDPSVLAAMQEQLKASSRQADINQMIDTIRSPSGVLAALFTTFVLFTILPAAGGALGAKLLERGSR
jgi:zinc-ribbon domain